MPSGRGHGVLVTRLVLAHQPSSDDQGGATRGSKNSVFGRLRAQPENLETRLSWFMHQMVRRRRGCRGSRRCDRREALRSLKSSAISGGRDPPLDRAQPSELSERQGVWLLRLLAQLCEAEKYAPSLGWRRSEWEI